MGPDQMVLLHVKGNDKENEFLYQCTIKDSLDIISKEVIKIHNLRITLKALCHAMRSLMQLNTTNCEDIDEDVKQGPILNKNVITKVTELIEKIEAHISIERVKLRQKGLIRLCELESFMNNLRGALLILFPNANGLSDNHILQQILFENVSIDKADAQFAKVIRDPATAQLWFTSKKLLRTDTLKTYIGNNEKTKIVVKISKANGHMPMRENAVDPEMRKKMMAFWYKKQETEKELQQDDDNSYLETDWANTNSLKKALSGMDAEMKYN